MTFLVVIHITFFMQQLHLSKSVWVENLDQRHLEYIIVNIHYPVIEWDLTRGQQLENHKTFIILEEEK